MHDAPITAYDASGYKFTGKERDSETSMDYSLYRMYNSAWGRWLSADPVHGRADDPQTQDLYAYVRNNPLNLVDPLGNVFSSDCLPPTDTSALIAPGILASTQLGFFF